MNVPFYTFVSCLLESMQRGGRERAACGGAAGGPFSPQEDARREEAGCSRKRSEISPKNQVIRHI